MKRKEKWNFIRKFICFPFISVERPLLSESFLQKQRKKGNFIPVTSGEWATAVIANNNRLMPRCFPAPLYWLSSSVGTQHHMSRCITTQYFYRMFMSDAGPHGRTTIHSHTQMWIHARLMEDLPTPVLSRVSLWSLPQPKELYGFNITQVEKWFECQAADNHSAIGDTSQTRTLNTSYRLTRGRHDFHSQARHASIFHFKFSTSASTDWNQKYSDWFWDERFNNILLS